MPIMPALRGGPIAGSGPNRSGVPSAHLNSGKTNSGLMAFRFSTFL